MGEDALVVARGIVDDAMQFLFEHREATSRSRNAGAVGTDAAAETEEDLLWGPEEDDEEMDSDDSWGI